MWTQAEERGGGGKYTTEGIKDVENSALEGGLWREIYGGAKLANGQVLCAQVRWSQTRYHVFAVQPPVPHYRFLRYYSQGMVC